MTFAPADIDDPQEASRVRAAIQVSVAIKQAALREHLRGLGRYERALVEKPAELMDDADIIALRRMTWAYRRQLPASVRRSLSIPMDDPLVRERNAA